MLGCYKWITACYRQWLLVEIMYNAATIGADETNVRDATWRYCVTVRGDQVKENNEILILIADYLKKKFHKACVFSMQHLNCKGLTPETISMQIIMLLCVLGWYFR